uniref:Vps53 N-terminal domain-containing protein n=1 Tax=Kalanchoe fedtschenkoi TaxID=63787 RepID=A0A7N0T4R0_KALFE
MDKSSALEYINQMFPTDASLSGVEPLMQKIHNEIRLVDAGIVAAVRQQHITVTITALHRLTMLVSAVEQLQGMASKRQYKETAVQLEAVNQLCSHFEAYRDIPKIRELREKFKHIKQILKSHVFSYFSSLGTGKESKEKNLLVHLSDACLVVDALESSVREDLVKSFCSRELTSYQQIFEGAELAKLDKAERRYAWIKRRLRTNKEIWKIFPPHWRVPYLLCTQFCKLTRTQLIEILNYLKEKPDVGTLLLALQRTLEFEEELAEKLGAGTRSTEKGSNSNFVSDIRKKYEKKLAANQDVNSEFNFRGIISSCFEPHLTIYIELVEKTLMENLETLVQVFLIIRRSLKHCSALTKSQTFFNLLKRAYRKGKAREPTKARGKKAWLNELTREAAKLYARLPKGGSGIVAAAATGMDGQIKTSDRNERVICYIVNTAEYCHKTSEELAENVLKIIDSQLADAVGIINDLVHGIETKFDAEMTNMAQIPWATLEGVGDQSEYVNGINLIRTSSIPVLGSLLSHIYFQYFLHKDYIIFWCYLLRLASSLAPRFYPSIFKCKQISETGAQQTILLDIPCILRKTEGTPSEFQRILDLKGHKKADQQTIMDHFNKHSTNKIQSPTAPQACAFNHRHCFGRGRGAATTGFKRFLALTEAAKDRTDGPFRKLFNPLQEHRCWVAGNSICLPVSCVI